MNRIRALVSKAMPNAGEGGSGGAPGGAGIPFGGVGRLLVGLGLVGYGLAQSLFNVEGGHRAVVFNRFGGVSDEIRGEGTHIVIPWFQVPTVFDVRTRPRMIHSLTGSRDLQMVNITLRVLYKPDVNRITTIFKSLGTDYDERVLPSIGNEVLKSVVAQFTVAELLTKRPEVSREVSRRLVARAAEFHILVDDVSLTHVGFGKDYMAAVEAKQVAQQEAERAKFLVQQAVQDKQSIIIRAEGEARAAAMIGEAMSRNPSWLELKRIEAAKDIASTVSNSANRVYLNADSLMLNLVNAVGFEDRIKGSSHESEKVDLDAVLQEVNKSIEDDVSKVKEMQAKLDQQAAATSASVFGEKSPSS